MSVEDTTRQKFEWYTRDGSIFDQFSWRLRPDHIEANGMMSRDDLKNLCWHFYVYGVADSTEIKQKVLADKTSKEERKE